MIKIAADVGEGSGADAELLPLLDVANVCCGVHAGSPAITAATARRCQELGVIVGAHPGYADRPNFGRVEVGIDAAAIERLIESQVVQLAATARPVFIKPHGALYHRCQADPEAAAAAVRVAARWEAVIVGQPGFELVRRAEDAGVPVWLDGYADRGYESDGSLVPRGRPGALLDPGRAAAQAAELAKRGGIDVICIHGDSPGAVEVLRAVRAALGSVAAAEGDLPPKIG